MNLKRYKSLYEQEYIIYCDLDGVLSDFNKAFIDNIGMHPKKFEDKYGINEFWKEISKIDHFWLNMQPMKNAGILWKYIKKYNPILLTTPADGVEQCKPDKLKWVKKYLGYNKVIFEKNKEKYASPSAILIDDREDNIQDFNNANGIGILFKSANQVIDELKDLGL